MRYAADGIAKQAVIAWLQTLDTDFINAVI
jgi:hypothetical protein